MSGQWVRRQLSILAALALCAVFGLAATAARSDEPDWAAEWAKHGFSGAPGVPNPQPLVRDYLRYDVQNCGKKVDHIITLMDDFIKNAVGSSKKSDPDMKEIHDLLVGAPMGKKKLVFGPEDPCFRDAAAAYILSSINASDAWPNIAIRGSRDPKKAKRAFWPSSPAIFLLTASGLNEGWIKILTPRLRGIPEFCGGWRETYAHPRSPYSSDFAAQGGYSCGGSKIYIEPVGAPIDLAARMTHELDHLIRDKLTSYDDKADSKDSGKGDGTTKVDWIKRLVTDESLALVTTAHRELVLQTYRGIHNGPVTRVASTLLEQLITHQRANLSYPAYHVHGDETQYLLDGPISHLWEATSHPMRLWDFIAAGLLRGCRTGECGAEAPRPGAYGDNVSASVMGVHSAVYDAYFTGNRPLDFAETAALLNQGTRNGPRGLYSWLQNEAFWEGVVPRASEPSTKWEVHGDFGCVAWWDDGRAFTIQQDCDIKRAIQMKGQHWEAATRIQVPMDRVMLAIDALEAKLNEPTANCVALKKSGNDPDVARYRGEDLCTGDGPINPAGGEGGVKGDFPVSACYLEND